jgi:UDP-galactopyranose mutase
MQRIGIAGAGFSGAVIARLLAETGKYQVQVFDTRPHVAGNCHTERDPETGVMLHAYGPHIFHTSNREVWEYVQRFDRFMPFTNRVKTTTGGRVYSLPINLLTINQFFGKAFDPKQAEAFMRTLGDSSIGEPRNFEEQALKFLGNDLYRAFFYGYTKKQWGVEPTELPASILKRLPVRFNYDDNYYASTFQGMPEHGYTHIVSRILDCPGIEVKLGARLDPEAAQSEFAHVFYTGPIDGFFGYRLGRLRYRTLRFERFAADGDFQGNAVMNYGDVEVPYTRISEHKHFSPWEKFDRTVCFREYSAECGPSDTPYYPLRLTHDKELLEKYVGEAQGLRNVTFAGRLATYRYLDMHQVIAEALETGRKFLACEGRGMSAFVHPPLP